MALILAIDDSRTMRVLVRTILESSGWLNKPFSPPRLIGAVNQLLEQ